MEDYFKKPFSFNYWYPILENDCIKAKLVPLPVNFIEYLLADGIFLGDNNKAFLNFSNVESVDSSGEDWPEEGALPMESQKSVSFPQLYEEINEIICSRFDGKCFPKLNGICPSDASWMNWSGTMECSNADQVVLLLKSSDIISNYLTSLEKFKLEEIYSTIPQPFNLVLKKYYSISVGCEFRCIVKGGKLIGISQRYPNKLYPFLNENEDTYISQISTFFLNKIAPKFVEENFIFDLYIDKNRPWILDISPLNENLNLCLFTWDDILNMNATEISLNGPVYRVVNEESSIVFSNKSINGLPFELKNNDANNNIASIIEFMKKSDDK
jgi:hypothetical protein